MKQSVTSTCRARQHGAGTLPAWWTPRDGIICVGKVCISHNGRVEAAVIEIATWECLYHVNCTLLSNALYFQHFPGWKIIMLFRDITYFVHNIFTIHTVSYKERLG